MYQRILVPTDGSQLSDRAVKEAANLARAVGATLTLFYAAPAYRLPVAISEGAGVQQFVPPEQYRRNMRAIAKRLLDAAEEKAGGTATQQVCEFAEQPYEAIIKAAQKGKYDLIVMASHGWRGLKGLLLGSETHKVLTHSRIPVLVVR
jgi:nucleotide-binding universal stress UspA family protein